MTRLDELLPRWDVRTRHEVRVDAPPEHALAAVRAVTLEEVPVVRALFALRGFRLARGALFEAVQSSEFELLAVDERELILGAIGKPWTPSGGLRRGVEFARFADPGYAKMAMSFEADGATLATETRVLLTDAASRRRFRRYWIVVAPFSALIRRLWLSAAKRRAERQV